MTPTPTFSPQPSSPALPCPKDEARTYFLSRILPLIAADFDPITICDPCCGSGVMLLAGARQFPAWAAQAGLVQLYGMDIDQTCVTMAQVNMMLYGLNGAGLHSALTATSRQLARLPEPFEQAYTLAQEANANGDADLVEEIADTLRVQQALFDVDEFTQRMKHTTAHHRPAPATATRRCSTHHVEGRMTTVLTLNRHPGRSPSPRPSARPTRLRPRPDLRRMAEHRRR